MKREKLKSVLENLIRETVIRKLGEGQPIGGVKNDHEFDAGRNNVMKAVNVGENTNEILGLFKTKKPSNDIDMNQVQGHIRSALNQTKDRIKAISLLTQAQQKSTDAKLRDEYTTAIHYIKTARDLRQYMDSPNGEREPDFNNEMIGQDGRYSDDMESGVAVKKLHNLSEQKPSKKQLFIYPENFRAAKNYIRISKKRDTDEFVVAWFTNGQRNEPKCYYTNDAIDAWNTFALTKMEVDAANGGTIKEDSGTGAVAGYSTPYAFSKKKSGSQRAMDVTTKMGYKKVKDISQ